MDLILETRDLHFQYPRHEPVLRGVDFSLFEGERVGLAGGNGSGKSTFFRLLVGLARPGRGTIIAFDQERKTEADFEDLRKSVGLVFQNSDDQLFCPTVLEDVAFGPLNLGATPAEAREAARQSLAAVGLNGFEERITYKLSGGEQRLVAIATILSMNPKILLLDEPTAGLDKQARTKLHTALQNLPQAMVIINHDHDFGTDLLTRTVTLEDGRIG